MPFVVIRLRSTPGSSDERCIHLSSTNTLTVENSKTHQDFTFDMIAPQNTSQFTIFNSVIHSFQETIQKTLTTGQYRMDHLVMAYGQSGSGKSYTVFGERKDQGILPQLIDKLNDQGYELKIRAFEIYNQQFYDLLINFDKNKQPNKNQQVKTILIKQDLQKGVHIEGLDLITLQKEIPSINLIQDILNYKYSIQNTAHDDRKSHKILTLFIKHPKYHQTKELKLHFVELASCDGQRQYFTKRPSISINKSLNTLNIILSNLMDIANGKPKKHIPFRDSKLTFYLKDMLSASSSNKWIFTSLFMEKNKLSESVNSLMFAKRAKCLVQGTIDIQEQKTARRNIRMQVKAMRKQLQNSRFIHGKSIDTQWQYPQQHNLSPSKSPMKQVYLSPCKSRADTQRDINKLQLLLQNQLQLRHIIKMYQQRITFLQTRQLKKQIIKGIYNEKRLLQNLNHKYAKLVLNFPVFANIISQNQKLKLQMSTVSHQLQRKSMQIYQMNSLPILNSLQIQKFQSDNHIFKSKLLKQDDILSKYEKIIQQLKEQVRNYSQQLKFFYENDGKKNKDQPYFSNTIVKTIENQNDCLKLTILTQQQEIQRLHRQYSFISLQIKAITQQNRTLIFKNQQLEEIIEQGKLEQQQIKKLMDKLLEIKASAENDQLQMETILNLNKQLETTIQDHKKQEPVSKNRSLEGKLLNKDNNEAFKSSKLDIENKNLKRQIKQQDDKKIQLQKQLSKLSSKVAELNRELSMCKETQLSLYQQLTNSNDKVKALQTKQKIQVEKSKQYTLEMTKLKKQLQLYTDKSKQSKHQNNKSCEVDQGVKQGTIMMHKRYSISRKNVSDFDGITTSKSSKCLDVQKSLNTTAIISSQKLTIIMQPPRLSSGKKLIGRQARKDKQKQKDVKPFLFKSKQIKNSIVQKI